jgi:hypothetical protein
MRQIISGLFLTLAVALSMPGDVLYSFSESPYNPPGSYPSPAFSFEFTVPALLTSPTLIPGAMNPPAVPATGLNYNVIADSIINAPDFQYLGRVFSTLSVAFDPGLNGRTPMIGVSMGWDGQVVMSEGFCFDTIPSCYSSLRPTATFVFDYFGTYTVGDARLTISRTADPQTATPEPRFGAATGLLALLIVVGVIPRTRQWIEAHASSLT